MTRPDGLIELPNGGHLFYDDARHAYHQPVYETFRNNAESHTTIRRGKRLTSASTLSKPFAYDSGRLLNWKERMTCEGIAELVRPLHPSEGTDGRIPTWLYSGDFIRNRLKEASLLADDARDRKATIGTNVHRVLEGLAGVGPLPNLDEIPEEEKGYARAVFSWWERKRPEVLNVEQFVYSAHHGYAGRFDLRCRPTYGMLHSPELDGPEEPVQLIDLKTGWVGPSAHVQLQLYALAAYECGVGSCDELLILQVKEDGTWKEIPCRATEADAIHAIEVYRGVARIEREAKAA